MHGILLFIIANFNKERGNHGYERCLKASSETIYNNKNNNNIELMFVLQLTKMVTLVSNSMLCFPVQF